MITGILVEIRYTEYILEALSFYQKRGGVEMYQTILYEEKESIAYITFNRPEVGNAFSEDSFREITKALGQASQDAAIRAVVLTGKGKLFCGGGDIHQFKEVIEKDDGGIPEYLVEATGAMGRAIRSCSKPVIASINGAAAGAGMGVALAADFRIMEKRSSLVTAFIGMGLPGDTGVLYFLQKMVGTALATELMMFSKPVKGEAAFDLGLANKVVEDGMLEEETVAFAKQIAALPTQMVSYQKELFNEFFYKDLEKFNHREAQQMHLASLTDDHKEAVTAFFEKRKPHFSGR